MCCAVQPAQRVSLLQASGPRASTDCRYQSRACASRLSCRFTSATLPVVSAERVLSTRELNRALLARQFLLQRSTLPLVQMVERIGGLQTQYAPSGYIGLWSRLKDFSKDALTSALDRRQVIQGTLL